MASEMCFFLFQQGRLGRCSQEITEHSGYLIPRKLSPLLFAQLCFHTECPFPKALERNQWKQWDMNDSPFFKSADEAPEH